MNKDELLKLKLELQSKLEQLEEEVDDFGGEPTFEGDCGEWNNGYEIGYCKGKLELINMLLTL